MRKMIYLMMLLICVEGCRDEVISDELKEDIRSLPSRFAVGNGNHYCDQLIDRINSITNEVVRFACLELMRDAIWSSKISGEDRRQDSLLLRGGEYGLECINYQYYKNGLSRETAIANLIEPFRWMMAQGDGLKPTHRVDYLGFDCAVRRKYDEWQGSYLTCRNYLRDQLWLFEWHFTKNRVWFGGVHLSSEEIARIRSDMEEFLGRPLRTLEQLRAMRNVDSEEIKAVKRKEVGPACFARESDPPVSFTPLEVPKCETNKVPAEIGVEITERGSVPT